MAVIIVGTSSYITEAELQTYANNRGITIVGDLSLLLIKAMDYLESRNFIGYKTVSTQALQFPRIIDGYDSNVVPNEINKAQCIASILIGSGYDLQSTLGQTIKRRKVGPLETEYQDYSSGEETHRALNDILAPFVQSGVKVIRV